MDDFIVAGIPVGYTKRITGEAAVLNAFGMIRDVPFSGNSINNTLKLLTLASVSFA